MGWVKISREWESGQISPFITRFLRIKSPSFLLCGDDNEPNLILILDLQFVLDKPKVWKIIRIGANEHNKLIFVVAATTGGGIKLPKLM